MKSRYRERGEIVTVLTVISLGLMLMGIVVGKMAVSQPTQTQSKADLDTITEQPTDVPPTVASEEPTPEVEPTTKPGGKVRCNFCEGTACVYRPPPAGSECSGEGCVNDDECKPQEGPRPCKVCTTLNTCVPSNYAGSDCSGGCKDETECGGGNAKPTPESPTGTEPLPGHSKIDCGGVGNQCIPGSSSDCGNDGCLNSKLGRVPNLPTATPPLNAATLPTLPGRNSNECGGVFYQCNTPGVGDCGNDGCSNSKLGRVVLTPLTPPPEAALLSPYPGRPTTQCGGRYYQCNYPGDPDCAADGCNDRLLRRGKYGVAFSPTPKPNITPRAPTPTPIILGTKCNSNDKSDDVRCLGCKLQPDNQWRWSIISGCITSTPTVPTIIPISTPSFQTMDPCRSENYPVYFCGSEDWDIFYCGKKYYIDKDGKKFGPFDSIASACNATGNSPFVNVTPKPSTIITNPLLPLPQSATARSWEQAQKLSVENKIDSAQLKQWVNEAAKYYYPGIQVRYCDPMKGECDFRL